MTHAPSPPPLARDLCRSCGGSHCVVCNFTGYTFRSTTDERVSGEMRDGFGVDAAAEARIVRLLAAQRTLNDARRELVPRLEDLVSQHPNDSDLGAAVRRLVKEATRG
jgi:hypothetical protein